VEISKSNARQNSESFFSLDTSTRREFFHRVLIFVGVVTAVGLFLALLWQSTEVILLIFAGLLLAIFLDGIADWISRYTPLSKGWALTCILAATAGVTTLALWLFLPSLEEQFNRISQQVPETVVNLRGYLEQSAVGGWILERIPAEPLQNTGQSSNVLGRITGFFSSFLGIVVNVAIVLVAGIYFAYSPNLYYEGAIKLFPANSHKRIREVLDTLGYNLRRWIIGRLTVMTINGVLTALGLWLLGVPMAIPLGLLTAAFNFIPNIGPFLGAVPAVLIALTQNPTQALYVAILYLIIQTLEGFVLTPLVQQKAIALPPVLVISAQLLLGILFGFLGVLLAVPIVAVAFVLIKMLYVEDTLGNKVEVRGEEEVKEARRQTNDG
jgi:predicted PurR-regulated permease PerM